MRTRRDWRRLVPRSLPRAGLLAYALVLLLGLGLIWSRPGPALAVRALAPSRAVTTAPELAPPGGRHWLAMRLGNDFWVQVMRLAWPTLPGTRPVGADGSGLADPGGRVPLEPLIVLSASRALDLATMVFGGFLWSDPATWLAADIPVLAAMPLPRPAPGAPEEPGAPAVPPPAEGPARPAETGDLAVFGDEPQVLVYHTHATESFRNALPAGDEPFTDDRSLDVVRVGDELAAALAAGGVEVVHSRALYDAGGRVGAYERSLAGIEPILARYPSIRLIIDLHRDSADREATTATVGGRSVARVLLVVGTDKLLPHPDWAENAAFAARVASAVEVRLPGLVRRPDGQPYMVEGGRYNQHLAPGAILLEVGGVGNTLDEELRTARLLAPVFADLLQRGLVPARGGRELPSR